MSEPSEIVEQFFSALRAHDVAGVRARLSEDAVLHAPGGVTVHGREQYAAFVDGWLSAFPDLRWEQTAWHVAGDSVIIESTAHGTHIGTLQTPTGDVRATGATFSNSVCEIDTVRDGYLVETRLYWDNVALMEQLGLLPAPADA